MPDVNDKGNGYNNILVLISREERAALLKTGLIGKDIHCTSSSMISSLLT
jgi:hypothetical protein